jgi:hypothetical protein
VQTLHRRVVVAAKWAWVICVLVAAGVIVARSWHDILAMLRALSWWWLAASVALTAAAKLFLGENARIAATRCGIAIGYIDAFRLYNLSQLGKYLPGSIWQFVGRAAAYRNRGAGFGPIRDALLCESLWIVVGAAAIGALLTGPGIVAILRGGLSTFVVWWLAGGISLLLLAVAVAALWKRDLLRRYARLAMPPPRAIVVQAFIWALLGLAFWVLARACGLGVGAPFAIGLFAAGYAVGFMVPIAPAGLGIRDAVLTVGLMPYVPAGEALAVTVMARMVYLFVDLVLALGQEPIIALLRERAMHRFNV